MATRKRDPANKPDRAVAVVTRCQKCGSTDRDSYYGVVERYLPGLDRNGDPYTHVVWRRTRCRQCGQARIDRHYRNRPEMGAGSDCSEPEPSP